MRFITYLTLIPTFFTFVAIILINVGGVNPDSGSKYELMEEKNSAFSLLTWDYTVIESQQSSQRQSLHIYLNRRCAAFSPSRTSRFTTPFRCRNDRVSKLEDGRRLFSSTFFIRPVAPFRFDTLNLDVPLAFYIISALLVVVLMFMAPAASRGQRRRGIRGAAALLTGLAFISMLIASSVITAQMVRLRNQIRDDTLSSVRGPNRYGTAGGTSIWRINVTDVTLGTTVLGLTWAAVLALMIEFGMWVFAFMDVKNETPVMEMKKEEYVQG
ncbi:hypothetical protein VTL71DRAFT_7100 [Oculimacula yallundae]|uniref:Uncharacterized protein n=1 Tax=Oculimacula yallundae TaxID=86028 RepID=A0ABR4BVR6_9HELO